MRPLLKNYRAAAEHEELRPIARRYLIAGLKARAVAAVFMPIIAPIVAVRTVFDAIEWVAYRVGRALDRLPDVSWPWKRFFVEFDAAHEELFFAYRKRVRSAADARRDASA